MKIKNTRSVFLAKTLKKNAYESSDKKERSVKNGTKQSDNFFKISSNRINMSIPPKYDRAEKSISMRNINRR